MGLLIDIIVAAGAAWFWPHCARPTLESVGVAPHARLLVLGVTAATVGVYGLSAAAEIMAIGGRATWLITTVVGAVWVLVVGLGYLQNYALLRRLTR